MPYKFGRLCAIVKMIDFERHCITLGIFQQQRSYNYGRDLRVQPNDKGLARRFHTQFENMLRSHRCLRL